MTNDEIVEIINLLMKLKNHNLELAKPIKNVKINKIEAKDE